MIMRHKLILTAHQLWAWLKEIIRTQVASRQSWSTSTASRVLMRLNCFPISNWRCQSQLLRDAPRTQILWKSAKLALVYGTKLRRLRQSFLTPQLRTKCKFPQLEEEWTPVWPTNVCLSWSLPAKLLNFSLKEYWKKIATMWSCNRLLNATILWRLAATTNCNAQDSTASANINRTGTDDFS